MLLDSTVGDDSRESSICFELKHSSAVTQFGRLLARRRGLPPELCAAGGLLHDVYVIVEGGYADHAHKGAPISREMVERVGGFDESQILDIESIVYNHSDKHLTSEDPFAEFGKDIDVLDAFLYPGAFEWYLANKPLAVFRHYLARAKRVWAELGVPADPGFYSLDDYEPNWLDQSVSVRPEVKTKSRGGDPVAPPFLLIREREGWAAHFRRATWKRATGAAGDRLGAEVSSAGAKILAQLDSVPNPGVAMVWPAIERIEMIQKPDLAKRLEELLGDRAAEIVVVNSD